MFCVKRFLVAKFSFYEQSLSSELQAGIKTHKNAKWPSEAILSTFVSHAFKYTHEQRRTTREKTAETTAIFKAKIRGRDLVSCDLGSEEEPSSPITKSSSLH